jgi:hypothetical protein
MTAGSIGVMSIAPTTATSTEVQSAPRRPDEAAPADAPRTRAGDDRHPPPPGLGRFVDKTA